MDEKHWCEEHDCEFKRFEKEGRVWYSHKIEGTDNWHKEMKPKKEEHETKETKPTVKPVTDSCKNRSMALSYAKDFACALISSGKDINSNDVLKVAETWHKWLTAEPDLFD